MATRPDEVTDLKFYTMEDVRKILGVGRNKAYEIIDQINAEQLAANKLVIRGKVNASVFNSKF